MSSIRGTAEAIVAVWERKADSVRAQWCEVAAKYPDVIADLAIACRVGQVPPLDPNATQRHIGAQLPWRHVQDVLRLDPVDVDRLIRGEKVNYERDE